MNIMKRVADRILSACGYELAPLSEPAVLQRNFLNLVQAYEQRLNEGEKLIVPNERRPKLLLRLLGTPPSEAYFIIQALAACLELPGDVCEFGVAQGETSALIANEIAASGKSLHLFDSFEGLPKPTERDQLKDDIFSLRSMDAYTGTMSFPEQLVRARLSAVSFPEERYVVHKGFIEEVIAEGESLPAEVSFAYVDFDFYEPIKQTLEYLHRVTPKGAVIVVDDYNYFSTGAKTAVDEFVTAKNAGRHCYDCFVPDTVYGHFAVLTRKG